VDLIGLIRLCDGIHVEGTLCFKTDSEMIAQKHFQRLKHIYTAAASGGGEEAVAISFGRAELDGRIEAVASDAVLNRMPHQRLLTDAASLAAGSLAKEHVVTAEQFTVDVVVPEYDGPVVATAEVVMAEPPRSVVRAELWAEDEMLVAEAMGVFRPSTDALPSDPDPDADNDRPSPPPASFMPVHTTPYGTLCLN